MGLNLKLKGIISPNPFKLLYRTGPTAGNESVVSTDYIYYPNSSTTYQASSDGSYYNTNPIIFSGASYNTQYWFKFLDTVTGGYVIENIYTNEQEVYDNCINCCLFTGGTSDYIAPPTATPTATPTSTPTTTLVDCSFTGGTSEYNVIVTPTPTITSTPTITPTLTTTVSSLYLASTLNDVCAQINGQILTNVSYTGGPNYCDYTTLNSTEIPGLADGTYYVSDGINIRSWTKTSTPSVLYNPSICSTCPTVTPTNITQLNWNITSQAGGRLTVYDKDDNVLLDEDVTLVGSPKSGTLNIDESVLPYKIKGWWLSGSGNIVYFRVCDISNTSELYISSPLGPSQLTTDETYEVNPTPLIVSVTMWKDGQITPVCPE